MKFRLLLAKSIAILLAVFFTSSLNAQTTTVTGKVTDETGKGLSGVTVGVKGTSNLTTSNDDGSYTLSGVKGNDVLVFTSVGYQDQEISVNNRSLINLSLGVSQKTLSDVVVIGYGTQKKRNITGAESSFDARKLEERPLQRLDQALVGQLAGVTVKQTTGIPGKAFSIQIRGSGSISAGNEPLYVLDGFPLALNSSNTTNGSFSTGNPLDNINPDDIESIEVLKDAGASAIYGSRAANGVVLITTKRGKIGKPQINLNVYAGYNQASKQLKMLNADEWIDRATEIINSTYVAKYGSLGATANDNDATRRGFIGIGPTQINVMYMLDPRWSQAGHPGLAYHDWQNEIEQKGFMQNYEVSASGGTDAVKYFISGNYSDQDAFIKFVNYKAYSARANIEVNASKKLRIGLNIAPTYSVTQDPGVEGKDNIFHQALSMSPVQEDSVGMYPNIGKNASYFWSNSTNGSLGKLTYNKGTTKRYRTLGTIYAEYDIVKGLTFKTTLNLDNTDNIATTYVPYTTTLSQASRTFTGSNNILASTSGSYNSYRRQTFANENTLTYTTTIKGVHNLTAFAGYSYNTDRFDRVTMSSSGGYTSAVIQTLNAAAAVTGNTTSTKNVFISYFGRVLYDYKSKYLFLASFRYDGSSKFGASNQFAPFPAASIGWRLTEERFMKSLPVISDLKLRFSYGLNGNPGLLNDYASIATIGSSGYVLGSTPVAVIGQVPNVLANPDLLWERSKTYNIGLDFGILKNRITGSFDYYNKLSDDLLLNVQALGVTGFGSVLSNIGTVRNVGQELEITSHNTIGVFQWTTSINISHNTNKLLSLAPGQTQIIIPNGFTVSDQILRVGYPLNSIYVLKVIGFLSQKDITDNVARYGTGETVGDFKYEDTNKDGVITEADKQIVGHPNPNYTYGITNTFRYKNFDLSVLIQGQSGGSIYSQLGRALTRPGQGFTDNTPESFVNRWRSPDNQGDGRFGKAYSSYNQPISAATDWLYSSDYVRVRNITLGYNLKGLIKTNAIPAARVYLTLENFFGHDKYSNGLNPESSNTAVSTNSNYPEAGDYGGMPLPKSLIFGVSFTF